MSIAQCQSGVDDQRDSPSEQFTVDRMKLTNKGKNNDCDVITEKYTPELRVESPWSSSKSSPWSSPWGPHACGRHPYDVESIHVPVN